jgi:hypothetical protein
MIECHLQPDLLLIVESTSLFVANTPLSDVLYDIPQSHRISSGQDSSGRADAHRFWREDQFELRRNNGRFDSISSANVGDLSAQIDSFRFWIEL